MTRYQGIRPAFGYPACPDHSEKRKIFDALNIEKHTGIHLTENHSMYPAASVCSIVFSHPEADYIDIGKISKDQVTDYALRKQEPVSVVERWLGHLLNYK
jgi:5-methyltetrahydrofolate--homocysteine methyltransferase